MLNTTQNSHIFLFFFSFFRIFIRFFPFFRILFQIKKPLTKWFLNIRKVKLHLPNLEIDQ